MYNIYVKKQSNIQIYLYAYMYVYIYALTERQGSDHSAHNMATTNVYIYISICLYLHSINASLSMYMHTCQLSVKKIIKIHLFLTIIQPSEQRLEIRDQKLEIRESGHQKGQPLTATHHQKLNLITTTLTITTQSITI